MFVGQKEFFYSRKSNCLALLSRSAIFIFPVGIVVLSRGVYRCDRTSDSRLIYFNKWVIRSLARVCPYRGFSSGKAELAPLRDETRPSFDPDRSLAKAHYLYKALVYLDESIAHSWCISHRCDPIYSCSSNRSRADTQSLLGFARIYQDHVALLLEREDKE